MFYLDQIRRSTKDSDDESAEEVLLNPEAVRVGPGVPKLIHTGKPGRPKKYNLLGAMVARDVPIPLTYAEEINCEYASQWREAMQREYESLVSNKTWQIAELPNTHKTIGC